MSNAKKKPAKKKAAKKAPAKKAVAKKAAPAKRKAPAKKAVAKNASPKRKAPAVSVTTQPANTSTTATDVKVEFSVSGAPAPIVSAVSEIIRVNDVQSKSLRKRMLSWFTRK